MFKMTDRIWFSIEKDRPRSFLNYYYLLFKLVKLMGQNELLPKVPPLRTRLRLTQHDFIWKKVCDELGCTWKQRDIACTNQSDKPRQGSYKRKPTADVKI